jgi:hypothetical protein
LANSSFCSFVLPGYIDTWMRGISTARKIAYG